MRYGIISGVPFLQLVKTSLGVLPNYIIYMVVEIKVAQLPLRGFIEPSDNPFLS